MNSLRLAVALLTISVSAPRGELVAQQTNAAEQKALAEGEEFLRVGQAQQAKIRFDAAIRAASQSAQAYTWRGIAENQMQQYPAAAKDFQTALEISPGLAAAHYNLALSLIRLQKTDSAIKQLRIVIAAQPSAVQARYNLAILLEGKGTIVEAIDELNAARALAPTDQGVVLHLLVDHLKLNRSSQLSSFVNALTGHSTPQQVRLQAGTALVEAGRFAEALTILQSGPAEEPNTSELDCLVARAYIGNGKYAEAVALLEAIPAEQRDEGEVYFLALAYTGTGNLSGAAEAFEAAARLDPKDGRPLYHLGLLAAASANGQVKSVQWLRSAIQLDPGNGVYALALSRVLLVLDQADEAKIVLSRIVPAPDTKPQVDALRGVAFAATHEIDNAIPELRKAVEEDSTLALAHNVLGFCLFQKGNYAEAATAYGEASRLEPNRLLYARDAALAYERANQPGEALRFAEQAKAQDGSDAATYVLLGKLYTAANRRPDAIRELNRAAELNPDLDAPYYLLARTYMQMGDRTQAAEWNNKLSALKERHAAAITLQKKAVPVRSSTLLQGGSLSADDTGAP